MTTVKPAMARHHEPDRCVNNARGRCSAEPTASWKRLSALQSGDADAALMYVADTSTSTPGALKVVGIPGPDPPFSCLQWHSNELGTIVSDAFTVVDDCPAALVKGAPDPEGATAFIAYLESSAGRERLHGAGLVPLVS
jgi:ABC-type molybdate transport system substrate-binding protein